MVTKKEVPVRERDTTVSQALAYARIMQENWLECGLNFVDLYIEDTSEENQQDDDQESKLIASIERFLLGNDPIALVVRNLIHPLENSPNFKNAIARKLAHSLAIQREDNQRLYEVKTVLVDCVARKDKENQIEVNLLELAIALMQKIEAIKIQENSSTEA